MAFEMGVSDVTKPTVMKLDGREPDAEGSAMERSCGNAQSHDKNRIADSRAYWDMRAETFGGQCGRNHYIDTFIERLALREGESVLDMGCATGSLAVPLAQAGHTVFACDFSPKMIEKLTVRLQASGRPLPVQPKLMAWQDDWEAAGAKAKSVDVAVASRSIPLYDDGLPIEQAIAKLDDVARRKAAITVSASVLPASEPRLLQFLGRPIPSAHDHIKTIEVLASMGRYPELSYIICSRPMHFKALDAGIAELHRMAVGPLSPSEEEAFAQYAAHHFHAVDDDEGDGGIAYELDYPLMVRWALISWSTENR